MGHDKWWRRQGQFRGRYAPRLWPVWVAAPLWVAVAGVLAWSIYLRLWAVAAARPGPNSPPPSIDSLDVIKATITVAGFVGAVLVGVYGYRKQRLVEGEAHRADAEQFARRYTSAADQLGHEKAAVRLAGVYAMARLADDWYEQRQVCIDVLCAYLRMPYEPNTASEKHREGEREVRHTIIRLIRDHLRDPSDPATWCGHDLNFTNATFDGGDFDGAKFTEGTISFRRAQFTDGSVYFGYAKFISAIVSFRGAKFADGKVSFDGAKFAGGKVSFRDAEFTGGTVAFQGAEFAGSEISLNGANFTGSEVSFNGAKFAGGELSFAETGLTGGKITFNEAALTGGGMRFFDMIFSGGVVSFHNARFIGGAVLFKDSEFGGSAVYFSKTKFIGGTADFSGAVFSGGTVSFYKAELESGDVLFADAAYRPGCKILWGPFESPAAWAGLQETERRQNEPSS